MAHHEDDELDETKEESELVEELAEEQGEEYDELIRFTLTGWGLGLTLAFILDALGFRTSGLAEWAVRTLSGEGESIFEGVFAFRKRIQGSVATMAQAYGWGKLIGMTFPWWVDLASRLAGLDVHGVEGFFIPYFYALGDQIGANVSGLVFLRGRMGSWSGAFKAYVRDPVMLSSLTVILFAPAALFIVRALGFRPDRQLFFALETIAVNLCWVPPAVGFWRQRQTMRSSKK